MSSEIPSLDEEIEHKQKLIRIRQAIEEYINGNPETPALFQVLHLYEISIIGKQADASPVT